MATKSQTESSHGSCMWNIGANPLTLETIGIPSPNLILKPVASTKSRYVRAYVRDPSAVSFQSCFIADSCVQLGSSFESHQDTLRALHTFQHYIGSPQITTILTPIIEESLPLLASERLIVTTVTNRDIDRLQRICRFLQLHYSRSPFLPRPVRLYNPSFFST